MKGIIKEGGVNSAVRDLLARGMEAGLWDAAMVPARVPAGDSYAWLLCRTPAVLEETTPLPPVMAVSGARALYKLARHGISGRVAVVLRPCEVRAAVELFKREQLPLDDIFVISLDCPGAVPLKDYVDDPGTGEETFNKVASWEEESTRAVCRTCDHFSMTTADIHIGTLGVKGGNVLVVPAGSKGETAVEKTTDGDGVSVDEWENEVKKRTENRKKSKEKANAALRDEATGPERLAATLGQCISCYGCRSVCPICICRQCYFESEAMEVPAANTFTRAVRKGAARLPKDTFLFHLGRMAHMSLSCVSCGACEDACPAHIPVAQLFSLVGENTQRRFDYEAGRDRTEPLPMTYYEKDELDDVTEPYVEVYQEVSK